MAAAREGGSQIWVLGSSMGLRQEGEHNVAQGAWGHDDGMEGSCKGTTSKMDAAGELTRPHHRGSKAPAAGEHDDEEAASGQGSKEPHYGGDVPTTAARQEAMPRTTLRSGAAVAIINPGQHVGTTTSAGQATTTAAGQATTTGSWASKARTRAAEQAGGEWHAMRRPAASGEER